jgi:N-acetylneuraminate synthase
MVRAIRNVEDAIGCGEDRRISQGERLNREILAKSLVAARDIAKDEKLTEAMIEIRSPGRGLQPDRKAELVGLNAPRNYKKGDIFYPSDISGKHSEPRAYRFGRPWGIPVRYHDVGELVPKAPLDFVELHFSYRDLDLNPADYIDGASDIGFVVHSPELFAGDHVMDLSSNDATYRQRSISELKRVIDRTRQLKTFFPKTERPLIIVNPGGFTFDRFLPVEQRRPLYDRIADALEQVDRDGVEIIPQTMPPLPWHFGGQRFHNLFVDPDEIVSFCKAHRVRICLDTSHSKLACNYFGWSLRNFIRLVGPFTAHLHIVDARGQHDEGLQISTGEIDFEALGEDLDTWAPRMSFIPEIWQGHKNGGEGFWLALDRLEQCFGTNRRVGEKMRA